MRIFMTFAVINTAVALVLLLTSVLPAAAFNVHRGASCQAEKTVTSGTYGIYCCGKGGGGGSCVVRLCPRGPSPNAGMSYVLVRPDCVK